jgi:hypothetical protein
VACAGAGFAKLDQYPGKALLELFVDACMARKLQGFNPQELSNVISGEYRSVALCVTSCIGRKMSDRQHLWRTTGLGHFERDPGEAFVNTLISRCLEQGLRTFAPMSLGGLIDVSIVVDLYALSQVEPF